MYELMELWEELIFEIGSIKNNLLTDDENKTLIGMGNREAKILFIGNDPSLYSSEEYKVDPNTAGEFLLKLLDLLEIFPDMYYITTLTKKNAKFKSFSEEERLKFIDLNLAQIALINPKIIIFLGKEAAETILKRSVVLEEERNSFNNWKGDILTYTTYDIETVISARKENGKKSLIATNFWNDLKKIKSKVEENE